MCIEREKVNFKSREVNCLKECALALNWLNIYECIEYNKGILVFKILHGLAPSYLRNLFTFQSSNNYQFRSLSNGNLCIPRHATESFKRSLQYFGATLWNCLPVTVRTSKL